MELSREVKIQIIKERIAVYQQQLYGLQLDYKVAETLEDEAYKQKVQESTKRQLQIIEVLEGELENLS